MTITTRAGLIAAAKAGQEIEYTKTISQSSSTNALWFTMFDIVGIVGRSTTVGVLAGTSTTVGVVPTASTAGMPAIDSFNGNAGLIHKAIISGAITPQRCHVNDLLFKSGAHNFNAADTLATQPSYSARIPGGTDYTGLEIWVECVTSFTGNPDFTVTYTSDAGGAGHTTGVVSPGLAMVKGRLIQLPLQAGDSGVQKIESVTCATATVGTFNVLVLRPLIKNLCTFVAGQDAQSSADQTGFPLIFDTSAIYPLFAPGNANSFAPSLILELASG